MNGPWLCHAVGNIMLYWTVIYWVCITLGLRQNGHHFANNIFIFQIHFRILYFNSNCIEICPPGSHWQKASIGWDYGLVPNRWQAIISTNDCPVYRHIYVSFSLNEISCFDNIFDIEIASRWLCYNKGQVALVWRLQKVRQWCVYYEYSPRKYCA